MFGLNRGLPNHEHGERGGQVAEGDEHEERREDREKRLDCLRFVLGQRQRVAADAERSVGPV